MLISLFPVILLVLFRIFYDYSNDMKIILIPSGLYKQFYCQSCLSFAKIQQKTENEGRMMKNL